MRLECRVWRLLWVTSAALIVVAASPFPSHAQEFNPNLFSGMHWRLLGPFRAGRSVAVAGVPSQPAVFYFGAADGGVWETINAGTTWKPIFDNEPIASIGAIAVSPSNPNIIYVGTGESDPRSQMSYGNGVYKSTDGGKTWVHIGLDKTQHIGKIIIDPHNPDRVFVAALGDMYAASPERGVYESTNGGKSWKRVLFKNDNVGAIDLAFDPRNSKIVYASLWATRRPPWSVYPPSNGPGSGLYKSTDGGSTWEHLTKGLPTIGVGKIGVAVAPTNPNRVYAIIDAKQGGLYRSDDAGATWKLMDDEARIWGRGWYFSRVTVDPKNENKLYVMNTSTYRSTDGGKNFDAIKGHHGGDDYHRLWINPNDPNIMALSSDQGTIVSLDGAKSWSSWNNQPTGQFYHIAADNRDPFWVYGPQQDNGPKAIVTDVPYGRINYADWTRACTGGESDSIAIDPSSKAEPELYATNLLYDLYDSNLTRCNQITGKDKVVTPWAAYPGKLFRHTWTLPLTFSMAGHHALYFANQFLFKTTNKGETWQIISPDLSRKHPGVPANLNPAAAADTTYLQKTGSSHWGVIYTIAPSPLQANTIWVGTDDGLIWVTRDGGKHWKNVTPPEVTPWSKVIMMDASHFDANTAYAAIDRHRLNDYTPHVLRTTNGGRTWQEIDKGLPSNAYVMAIKQDPDRKGLLFAGTSVGVYVSFDSGDQWQSLRQNMPVVEIRDFVFHDNSVAIATFGRGLWIMDDLNPLHQLNSRIAQSSAYLFKPETAILKLGKDHTNQNVSLKVATDLPPIDIASGAPRMKGAILDYYLKSDAKGPVTLEILNASGKVIRRYSSATVYPEPNPKTLDAPAVWLTRKTPAPLLATAGMHRFSWDLRATALEAQDAVAPLFGGYKVLPGHYTVKLSVDGKSYTQPLMVRLKSSSQKILTGLEDKTRMVKQIIVLQAKVSAARREVMWLRKQLATLREKASGRSGIISSIAALDRKAKQIEGYAPPPNPDTTGVGDAAPAPNSLEGLRNILGGISRTTQESMGAPTPTTITGFNKMQHSTNATLDRWSHLKIKEVAHLNMQLREAGLPAIKL